MNTLTVQPSAKDTHLSEQSPTSNYGSVTSLLVEDQDNTAKRAILEFDLSALPPGATLVSATLQLYYSGYNNSNPVGRTIWAYKQTHPDWQELEATWNIYKTGSNWASPGGDYLTANPAGGSTTFPASFGWMSWDVLAIVQDAYDSSIATQFLVKFETEQIYENYSQGQFRSRNYTINTSLRPKLVIEYTVPAIARSCGLIMG